jgi:hypothetical protein
MVTALYWVGGIYFLVRMRGKTLEWTAPAAK